MQSHGRSDDGWGVFSLLLTGVFVVGGLGWLGDVLLGTAFLLPVGLVGGAALSLYSVYMRYLREVPLVVDDSSDTAKGRR